MTRKPAPMSWSQKTLTIDWHTPSLTLSSAPSTGDETRYGTTHHRHVGTCRFAAATLGDTRRTGGRLCRLGLLNRCSKTALASSYRGKRDAICDTGGEVSCVSPIPEIWSAMAAKNTGSCKVIVTSPPVSFVTPTPANDCAYWQTNQVCRSSIFGPWRI